MTVHVGDILTATAAVAHGDPFPTRTWQWLRDSVPIPGATGRSYVTQVVDLGAEISVKQIETNIAGTAEAISAPVVVFALEPMVRFIPLGSSSLITADSNLFKVTEA